MYRNIMDEMAIWYEQPDRKMLYIKGAYGVGKTWSVKDFSAAFFGALYYIDLTEDANMRALLNKNYDVKKIDELISKRFDGKDLSDGLVVFDEINECEEGLEAVHEYAKYRKDITVCAISSFIKATEYEEKNKRDMHVILLKPMCFQEYLIANKENKLIELIENLKVYKITPEKRNKIMRYLKEFLVIGGMPAVVSDYLKKHDFTRAAAIQAQLLEGFEQFIKKNTSKTICTRTRRIIRSIPKQLEKDNKKFMFSLVEENARKREYSEAVDILCDMGIAIKINCIKEGKLPLAAQEMKESYELFMLDCGLLFSLMNEKTDVNLSDEEQVECLFNCLNGGFGEQFVMAELIGNQNVGNLYYWVSGATARVPMVFEGDNEIIPVDIRFESNSKAQNIKVFKQKYKTRMSLRLSIEDMYYDNTILNIPVYGLWNF